jgi:uncharacterized protein DUF4184
MPFTIAHPAAVIPIHRYLSRWTVPSALVIGSIAPDLAYLLPARIPRAESHSFAGLFWFCLPVGCAVYLLFHLVMKHPMLRLVPVEIARRLGRVVEPPHGRDARPWLTIGISVLLGAATHLAWDAFTHGGTPAVRAVGFLRSPLFSIGSYPVATYTVLQHGSTLFGLAVLGWWIRRWLHAAPVGPAPSAPLSRRERLIGTAILVTVPVACGIVVGISRLSSPVTDAHVQRAVGRGVVSAFASFGLALFAFSTWWQLSVRRRSVAEKERSRGRATT